MFWVFIGLAFVFIVFWGWSHGFSVVGSVCWVLLVFIVYMSVVVSDGPFYFVFLSFGPTCLE